jgi:hypothetical protein
MVIQMMLVLEEVLLFLHILVALEHLVKEIMVVQTLLGMVVLEEEVQGQLDHQTTLVVVVTVVTACNLQ